MPDEPRAAEGALVGPIPRRVQVDGASFAVVDVPARSPDPLALPFVLLHGFTGHRDDFDVRRSELLYDTFGELVAVESVTEVGAFDHTAFDAMASSNVLNWAMTIGHHQTINESIFPRLRAALRKIRVFLAENFTKISIVCLT